PRSSPAPAPQARARGRDSSARARFTLAASVALALGGCWILSNGFQPGERPNNAPVVPSILNDGSAQDKGILPVIEKNKALDNDGNTVPKIKMDKIGEEKE